MNILSPNINVPILHIFLMVLVERICLDIKTSFALFVWPGECMFKEEVKL